MFSEANFRSDSGIFLPGRMAVEFGTLTGEHFHQPLVGFLMSLETINAAWDKAPCAAQLQQCLKQIFRCHEALRGLPTPANLYLTCCSHSSKSTSNQKPCKN